MTNYQSQWLDVEAFTRRFAQPMLGEEGARFSYALNRLNDFPLSIRSYANQLLRLMQTPPKLRNAYPEVPSGDTCLNETEAHDALAATSPKDLAMASKRWKDVAIATGEAHCRAWSALMRLLRDQLQAGAIEGRGTIRLGRGRLSERQFIPQGWWPNAAIYANPFCAIKGVEAVENLEIRFAQSSFDATSSRGMPEIAIKKRAVGQAPLQTPAERAVCLAATELIQTRPLEFEKRHGRLTRIAEKLQTYPRFAALKVDTIAGYISQTVGDFYGDRGNRRKSKPD